MSVIKVLKEIKKDYELDLAFRKQVQENISKERIIALDSALLALDSVESLKVRVTSLSEQKERLEDWLKNKISLCNKTNKFYDLKKADYYSARIKTLKEVLKKLEEGVEK